MAINTISTTQPPSVDASDKGSAVLGKMHFLARDPKYAHEKPYTLRYTPAPESGIPQTNIARVEHPIVFHDWRGREDLRYEECGFGLAKLDEALPYDDFASSSQIEGVHAPRVLQAVRSALGAASAELVDYVVRRRHASWPVSTGEPYAFQQPASRAHIDHTYAGAVAVIREAHGQAAEDVLSKRWQLVK